MVKPRRRLYLRFYIDDSKVIKRVILLKFIWVLWYLIFGDNKDSFQVLPNIYIYENDFS